jgi:hypothetical protein
MTFLAPEVASCARTLRSFASSTFHRGWVANSSSCINFVAKLLCSASDSAVRVWVQSDPWLLGGRHSLPCGGHPDLPHSPGPQQQQHDGPHARRDRQPQPSAGKASPEGREPVLLAALSQGACRIPLSLTKVLEKIGWCELRPCFLSVKKTGSEEQY